MDLTPRAGLRAKVCRGAI